MHLMNKMYELGKSNSTSLPRGGLTVGVFLKSKDGLIVDSILNNFEEDFSIVWAVVKCSNNENYNRKKARTIALERAVDNLHVLESKNYPWETVKKISEKLVERIQVLSAKRFYNRNGLWQELKNSFSIDSWVENGMQSKDTIIKVDPLVGGMSIK